MCSKLFQIYQKRTPTFLAQITILIASVILLFVGNHPTCQLGSTLTTFYWMVFSLVTTEMLIKLILFSLIYSCNRDCANTFNTVVLILFALMHLALWIYSIHIYTQDQLFYCQIRDRFFIKCYVFAFGVMIIGGIALFILLMIPAVGVTFLAIRNHNKDKQEAEEVNL